MDIARYVPCLQERNESVYEQCPTILPLWDHLAGRPEGYITKVYVTGETIANPSFTTKPPSPRSIAGRGGWLRSLMTRRTKVCQTEAWVQVPRTIHRFRGWPSIDRALGSGRSRKRWSHHHCPVDSKRRVCCRGVVWRQAFVGR